MELPIIQYKNNLRKANIASQFSAPVKQCTANIIFNSKREILLLKRSSNDSFHPDAWCLPGGGVESGEKYLDAVKRETVEESGIEQDCYTIYKYKKIHEPKCDIHYFISFLHLDSEPMIVLDEGEHQQYQWCSTKEWLDMNLILQLKSHLLTILGIDNNLV